MLILASRSPRRRDLLRWAGIRFRVVAPAGDEPRHEVGAQSSGGRVRYSDLARRSALGKAREVAARERGLVLGADTIVVCDGRVLGKPVDAEDARAMLGHLSGRWHRVYTGLALVRGVRHMGGYECTKVAFRRLSKAEVDSYVGTGEPMDKAGAYAIQGRGGALVRAVDGCYTNVIGLPVPRLKEMLAEFERGARLVRRSQRGVR